MGNNHLVAILWVLVTDSMTTCNVWLCVDSNLLIIAREIQLTTAWDGQG